ncbi:NAD(P)-dependent oxidoreductase [Brevibacterium zhoupengii]|uniref:NAD(P)-dependent oxidoreductase n=1 Tax=Brevibacterium zhoupengii TaxID=2898795 RepID=UPI001E4C0FBE|nr:NAD(P)-dependent oxidoreductase [Brevibacterium zhoupengii]
MKYGHILWIGEKDPEVTTLLYEAAPACFQLEIASDDPQVFDEQLAQTSVIVNGAGTIDAPLMDKAPGLMFIQRVGAGIDGIDIEAAHARGIRIGNLSGLNAVSVAEHTILMMLAVSRHLVPLHNGLVAGRSNSNSYLNSSLEVTGKTIGIIGLGHIGKAVATRAAGLGMKVIYYDLVQSQQDAEISHHASFAQLDVLLQTSDVVSVHVPLTAETMSMIGEAELSTMKPGSLVLCMSRSGIVDEVALASHLERGHLAGAGIDVWSTEPPRPDDPLLALPNVVGTPHSGAQTRDAVSRCFRAAMDSIARMDVGEVVVQ